MNRREFFEAGTLIGVAGAGAACVGGPASPLVPTPSEIEGPFYPVQPQPDRDFDLTRVEGRPGLALGQQVWIQGRVVDQTGAPVVDAIVDIWQANSAGRYRHPRDPSTAPLDANFQGWAIVNAGQGGGFRFKTVVPGAYPADDDWDRPPHIHFKVSKRGYEELVTQMYFPDQPLNDVDRLLLRKSPLERAAMIAAPRPAGPDRLPIYDYRIVLIRV